jgi:hypothetical protein
MSTGEFDYKDVLQVGADAPVCIYSFEQKGYFS